MEFDKGLIGFFQFIRLYAAGKSQNLEGLAIGFNQSQFPFGHGLAAAISGYSGKQVKGVGKAFVIGFWFAGRSGVGWHAGFCSAVGSLLPGGTAASGIMVANFFGHILVVHTCEIVETLVVLAHMGYAKIMEFSFCSLSFRGALVSGQGASLPVALGSLGLVGSALARFDANGIKYIGTQRSIPVFGI